MSLAEPTMAQIGLFKLWLSVNCKSLQLVKLNLIVFLLLYIEWNKLGSLHAS